MQKYNETKYIDEEVAELIEEYKTALQANKCTGNLISSITSSKEWEDGKFTLYIEGLEYGIYLEKGTKPHFPPIDKIQEWIRIKPVLPRPGRNGKLPTERQLAFLISRKISRVGTEPTNHLSDTIVNKNYVERIALAVAKEMTKSFDEEHIKDLVAPKTKRI